METKKHLVLWLVLAMAIILEIFWDFYPRANLREDINEFPKVGIGYIGHDLPLTASEAKLYGSGNVVKRLYQIGKQQFVLMMLNGADNRHVVHDPIYCFRGAGWKVLSANEYPIKEGSAKILRLSKNEQEKEILYWFSDGNNRHGSILKYWGQSTLRRLTLGKSGQEPVLLILQPLGVEVLNWRKILNEFSTLLEI